MSYSQTSLQKTSRSSSSRRPSSTNTPPADVNGRSVKQLARLPAKVLRLHLASRHLVTSGPKATMAKRLYDAVNPSTINNGDNVSRSQVVSPPSTFSGDTPPSTNQLTATNTTLPPAALQAQLSSLMAQFLQYATPPASTSHEATRSTGNLSPASTEHHLEQPPLSTTAATNFSTVAVPPGPTTVTVTTSQPAFTHQASSLLAAVTFNVQAPPLMAHGAPTAVAPSYSDTVQPPIPALLPPATPATGWTMQQPPYHQLTTQPTVHPMATDTLPPVPAQIRQKIIQGEFIDFSVLLHRATFPGATADPLPSTQQPIKKISSFVMWMQAWNLYLLVILSHNPAKVLEMIPYQRLICSATTLLPLKSWLQYDTKFRTLAAANPLLRWD